jgi:hypothetical protein
MSAAFVPGCILRAAFSSSIPCSIAVSWLAEVSPIEGDLGPICISVGGGGLGSRGELGGKDMADDQTMQDPGSQGTSIALETNCCGWVDIAHQSMEGLAEAGNASSSRSSWSSS